MYSISCSKLIVEKFQASPFIPPHGLFSPITRNPHWQTVIGSEAIRHKFFKLERNFNTKLERFKTKDNDFFDVEYTDNFEVSVKTVFILHGLESNPKGPLVTKMARSFLKRGFSCCIVSFRGCNGEDNDSPGAYHLGFTTDINQLVRTIHEKFPSKRLYLSGFSLGGNVVLKYLGELGEEAIALNIIGSVATCVPFDPTSCQKKLDQGFNRAVYSEVSTSHSY
jgi:predicted alpha/beta-fold hydrolase